MENRTIKFRLWDSTKKQMVYDGGFAVTPYGRIWDTGLLGFDWELNPEMYHLMQFTGLVDKNGVDIFEGDYLSDGRRIWEIKWRSAPVGFGMFLYEKVKKPFDGRLGRFTTSLMDYQCEKLEVVGNVHDNPEFAKSRHS